MRLALAPLALTGALALAGCSSEEFSSAMPNYQTVALDLSKADAQVSTQALDGDCHPHLFQRSRDLIQLINRQLYRVFGRVDGLVDANPERGGGNIRIWERDGKDSTVKLTMTQLSGFEYDFQVQFKHLGEPSTGYMPVASGKISVGGAAHAGSGEVHLNLTSLTRLFPEERANGTLDVSFKVEGTRKVVSVHAISFTSDRDGVEPMPNGYYVFARISGEGGSFKFQQEPVVQCPTNLDDSRMRLQVVARWATKNGTMLGRADAKGVGGQLVSTSTWMALTCFNPELGDASAEKYWQMKLVGMDGTVLSGDATYNAASQTDATTSCDPVFVEPRQPSVPARNGVEGDFDFSKVNFEDDSVADFPGNR